MTQPQKTLSLKSEQETEAAKYASVRRFALTAMISVGVALIASCGGSGASGGTSGGGASSSSSSIANPVVTSSSSFTVNEGIKGAFYTATATLSSGGTATWSISGADSDKFAINSSTGELSFKDAPDFGKPSDTNTDNVYNLSLMVTDRSASTSLGLSVEVQPWNKGGDRGLPTPPGRNNLPQPSGNVANLKVIPWAGFKSAVSYTFDDSAPSQIENWSVLKAQRTRVTFYINPVGNWFPSYNNTWRDAVSQGSEIGNHTMHHCRASQLNGADVTNCPNGYSTVAQELDDTTSYITSQLGQTGVWTMAYPFGDLGYQSEAKKRFFLCRGVSPGTIGATDTIDESNLPIIAHLGDPDVPGGNPVSVYNSDIDLLTSQGRWGIFLFHTVLPTTYNWGGGENVNMIAENMGYAKGLGTVWIDSVANIGAYWVGQRLLEKASVSTVGGITTWSWVVPANFPPGRKVRVIVDGGSLSQSGTSLPWNGKGYYEVSIDEGSLTWRP